MSILNIFLCFLKSINLICEDHNICFFFHELLMLILLYRYTSELCVLSLVQ
jgi:hypothetical protein